MTGVDDGRVALDLRLVPAALGCWTACLVAFAAGPAPAVALGVCSLVGAVVVVAVGRGGAVGCVLLGTLSLTGAMAFAVAMRVHAVETGPLRAAAERGAFATLEGTVADDPRILTTSFADQVLVSITVSRAEIRGSSTDLSARVTVFAPVHGWDGLGLGDRVTFRAALALPDRPGLTDAVARATGPPDVDEAPDTLRWAESVRGGLAAASAAGLPDDAAGLLPGMVVGDRSGLTETVEESFTVAGMSHLTAVSGANFTFVIGAVVLAAHAATLGPRTTTVLAVVVLVAFVIVARPSPSVLRAAVMGALGLLAVLTGRRRHVMASLCTAVCVLLAVDPALAVNVGFALSATATTALVVLAPVLTAVMSRGTARRRPVVDAVAVAVAAHLLTAPLVAAFAGTFSTVAVVANVLVAPVVGPVTVIGAVAAPVAVVSVPAAAVVAGAAALPLRWLLEIAERAASMPYASIATPSGPVGAGVVAVVVLAVGVVVAVVRYVSARRGTIDP